MKNALASLSVESVSPSLPALIDRAVNALANARSAAEVLEARDLASIAYDIAKKTARLAKAKQAHDELIAAAYRTQAHALEIEAAAKRRLADEYDAAQQRGEVNAHGGDRGNQHTGGKFEESKLANIPPQELHEARIIRDAENADPGIVSRTVNEAVAAGEEPNKALVRRAVLRVVKPTPPAQPSSELDCSADPREPRRARFMNIILEAERLASQERDLSALAHFSELADAADRVVREWTKIALRLRELAKQ